MTKASRCRITGAASFLTVLQLVSPSGAFGIRIPKKPWSGGRFRGLSPSPARPAAAAETAAAAAAEVALASREEATAPPPSWEDLSALFDSTGSATSTDGGEEGGDREPVLTLYRDTNGWCPFCERVWVCLRVKGLPYRERLINLFDKPRWYKDLVPTALVPAVLLHDEGIGPTGDGEGEDEDEAEGEGGKPRPERRLVWESIDVMRALDDAFPETPRLVLDTPEYLGAREQAEELTAAGFAFVYSDRNGTITAEEKAERRSRFESELDRLDEALVASGGPFRLGSDFTGADAEIVPFLERWRYQLPITVDVDITEGRPALRRWFDAMDSFAPYADRVAGDEYSWAAVASTFLRYFGGEDGPNAAAIERADAAAAELAAAFGDVSEEDATGAAAREAAAKLLSNREAVVADCVRGDPESQRELPRARDAAAADAVLRVAASLLLSPEGAVAAARAAPLADVPEGGRAEAALAARTVASRLCVPRDMGAPAARAMRGVLAIVADRLERESS